MTKTETQLEYYKSIKEEYRQYMKWVEDLWKIKLIGVGAIISFSFTELESTDLSVVAIIAIPALAMFIDILIHGISLHLRSISEYSAKNLTEIPIAQNWETANWSKTGLTGRRTFISFLGTIGFSYIIYYLALFIIAFRLKPEWTLGCLVTGIIITIVGTIIISAMIKKLYVEDKKENKG